MNRTLRGRPRLKLEIGQIVEAVYRHRQVVAAARELECSDSYIHVRLKTVGLNLRTILEAKDLDRLLKENSQ